MYPGRYNQKPGRKFIVIFKSNMPFLCYNFCWSSLFYDHWNQISFIGIYSSCWWTQIELISITFAFVTWRRMEQVRTWWIDWKESRICGWLWPSSTLLLDCGWTRDRRPFYPLRGGWPVSPPLCPRPSSSSRTSATQKLVWLFFQLDPIKHNKRITIEFKKLTGDAHLVREP